MRARPRLELLCVGSELLAGQLNTHQARLGLALRRCGLELWREQTLGDDRRALSEEIAAALRRSDALIVCGGLGPTFDDVTREAASDALGRRLIYAPRLFAAIEAKFRAHKLSIPEENKRQAFVLSGAAVLDNRWGSAPGQFLALPRGKSLFLLPGPTSEMVPMLEGRVLPILARRYGRGRAVEHFVVHLAGISESAADERLQPAIAAAPRDVSFTILSSNGQVDFHAFAHAATKARARALLASTRRAVDGAVGAFAFGEGEDTLESVAGALLARRRLTLAVAESCTGGLVGARLTSVPGSSAYFLGGALAYDNAVKERLLRVPRRLLALHGAVSAECARAMAAGARRAFQADVGLAVTGIAGPSGETKDKPVGLVHIAAAGPGRKPAQSRELRLSGGRDLVRARAAASALHLLVKIL